MTASVNAASIHILTDRSVYRRPGVNLLNAGLSTSRGVGTRIGEDDQRTCWSSARCPWSERSRSVLTHPLDGRPGIAYGRELPRLGSAQALDVAPLGRSSTGKPGSPTKGSLCECSTLTCTRRSS